jgi:hypothetical protein
MHTKPSVRVGLFGIGLDTYWPQFGGLLDRLTGYQKQIASRLRGYGVQLVDAGMVDNTEKSPRRCVAVPAEGSRGDFSLHLHLRAFLDRAARRAKGARSGRRFEFAAGAAA